MDLAVLDVIEWQSVFDLKTGQYADKETPLVKMAKEILSSHRYPGDLSTNGVNWVVDVALDLFARHKPEYMFLNFSQPYFVSAFGKPEKEKYRELLKLIFAQIDRFLNETGLVPIIVGSGDMVSLIGHIDLSALESLAFSGGMSSPRHAGLYRPTNNDLEYVHNHKNIAKVIPKNEIIDLFGNDEAFVTQLPDYFLIAEEGYTFKTFGSTARPYYAIPAENRKIPVFSPVAEISSITDFFKVVLDNLAAKNIALIIVEGVGVSGFPKPFTLCSNALEWYTYTPGSGQYLTITTGEHLSAHSLFPGFRYYLEDDENRPYPLSGFFRDRLPQTIGHFFKGRSAAAGTRGLLTHVAGGADISIECFARGLYNYGQLAVVK